MRLQSHGPNGLTEPSQVILPTIFDAYAQPDIMLPLVLANLLSSRLWELCAAALERAAQARPTTPGDGAASDDLPPALRQAQAQIDHHFEHLTPIGTAEIFGEIDLDEEADRLGTEVVAQATDLILRGLKQRIEAGTLDPAILECVSALIARRRFPAYHYASFDVVRASRHLVAKKKHAPWGLTSCLDETAIFCALVMMLPAGVVDTVVVLGSPEHYTAFGWDDAGRAWWFYGKNCLLSAGEWRELVRERHGGDAQAAFDQRFRQIDRILSVNGTWYFSTGDCSIPDDRLAVLAAMLDRYFGIRIAQFGAAIDRPRVRHAPSSFAPLFRELLAVDSLRTVRHRMLEPGGSVPDRVTELVLLAYRSFAVADLGPYLIAARRSPDCRKLGAGLGSIQAALDAVHAVPGRDSIFGDRDRIAMPDETLRLGTGSDRDLALLLHVLVESMPAACKAPGPIETRFCADDSYVIGPDFCVSLARLAQVDDGPPRMAAGRRLA